MGPGCQTVVRVNTDGADVVVGTWNDGRIGTFRGTPAGGKGGFAGTAFGVTGIMPVGGFAGYRPLLVEIVKYFSSGIVPVKPEETLEALAFMEAADISKKNGGAPVSLASVMNSAREQAAKLG